MKIFFNAFYKAIKKKKKKKKTDKVPKNEAWISFDYFGSLLLPQE